MIGWMGGQGSSGRAALLNPIGALSTRLWSYNCGGFLEPNLLSDHRSASVLQEITSSRTFPNDR
jgi:hypothetical protein